MLPKTWKIGEDLKIQWTIFCTTKNLFLIFWELKRKDMTRDNSGLFDQKKLWRNSFFIVSVNNLVNIL